ncbi:MAG: hypothetical protein GY870_02885 [archaeon]|nr:hypothetical protein [archaeon]
MYSQVVIRNNAVKIELSKDSNDIVGKIVISNLTGQEFFTFGSNLGLIQGSYIEGKEKKKGIDFKFIEKLSEKSGDSLIFSSINDYFDIILCIKIQNEQINDNIQKNNFKQVPSDFITIQAKIEVKKKLTINYLRFDLNLNPKFREPFDFIYVPHLRPEKNYIMGDHIFRSPVITILKDNLNFALIPDVKTAVKKRKYKQHLDMDYLDDFRISYGFRNYGSHKHVFFRSKIDDLLKFNPRKRKEFELKFFLKVGENEEKKTLLERITKFMWNYWAKEELISNEILPQTLPYEDFSSFMIDRFSDPEIHNGWREFNYKGEICGGLIHRSWTGKFRGVYRTLTMEELETQIIDEPILADPRVRAASYAVAERPILNPIGGFVSRFRVVGFPNPVVEFWNQSWYLNVRTAFGLKILGDITNNEKYKKMSESIINLAKNSPEEQGLFSNLAYLTDQGVGWIEGTLAFSPFHKYNIVDIALTGYWLLKYSQNFNFHSQDILKKVEKAINTILRFQLDSGAFPTILKPEKTKAGDCELKANTEILYETPGSSAIGMVLCELFKITKNKKYLEAAEKIVPFLKKEIIPTNKWYDYETFYSCTATFLIEKVDLKDKYTRCLPQNNMCIYWTADFLRKLYECTENLEYLDLGKYILDYLTLFQQSWSAPFLSFMGIGGFGCQNNDGEWSDTRQGLFARELMEYYLITGEERYIERAIAALKSSYVLLQHENNKVVAPGNFKWSTKEDYGTITENYSHLGYDHRTPGHISVDWGNGTALLAYTTLYEKLGDLSIDLKNVKAYGVNACSIRSINVKNNKIIIDLNILPEKKELSIHIVKFPEESQDKIEIEIKNIKTGKSYLAEILKEQAKIKIKID